MTKPSSFSSQASGSTDPSSKTKKSPPTLPKQAQKNSSGGRRPSFKKKSPSTWNQRVVQVQRVTKVVKGGRILSFRTTVVLGNKDKQVGIGVGKADEVSTAVKKAIHDAQKNLVSIPLTKNKTIPHMVHGRDGASHVLIRPAGPGTGVIAGSSIRIVLELAGIQNILAKQLGGNNLLNNARATSLALKSLKTPQEVAKARSISLESLFS